MGHARSLSTTKTLPDTIEKLFDHFLEGQVNRFVYTEQHHKDFIDLLWSISKPEDLKTIQQAVKNTAEKLVSKRADVFCYLLEAIQDKPELMSVIEPSQIQDRANSLVEFKQTGHFANLIKTIENYPDLIAAITPAQVEKSAQDAIRHKYYESFNALLGAVKGHPLLLQAVSPGNDIIGLHRKDGGGGLTILLDRSAHGRNIVCTGNVYESPHRYKEILIEGEHPSYFPKSFRPEDPEPKSKSWSIVFNALSELANGKKPKEASILMMENAANTSQRAKAALEGLRPRLA